METINTHQIHLTLLDLLISLQCGLHGKTVYTWLTSKPLQLGHGDVEEAANGLSQKELDDVYDSYDSMISD